ncbi:MAG: hypothetical protein ABIH23_14740 [bacterium]
MRKQTTVTLVVSLAAVALATAIAVKTGTSAKPVKDIRVVVDEGKVVFKKTVNGQPIATIEPGGQMIVDAKGSLDIHRASAANESATASPLPASHHARQVGQAVCLEVEMNVCVELLPQNEVLKTAAESAATFAEQYPDNATMAIAATNTQMAFQSGLQYSFPASLFVDLAEDGSIERCRIEYLAPGIDNSNPSFTPQNPPIKYKFRITIIRDAGRRYISYYWLDTGKLSQEVQSADSTPQLGQAELWIRPYGACVAAARSGDTPSLTTSSFRRYDIEEPFEATVELTNDGREMRLYSGEISDPRTYVLIQMGSHEGYPFPLVVESQSKGGFKNTSYFSVTQVLSDEESQELFVIP